MIISLLFFENGRCDTVFKTRKGHTKLRVYFKRMGKLAEAIILKKLKETEEELQIIPDEQFGFRQAHSTELGCVHHQWIQSEGSKSY